jgi:hypothetical protein
VVEEALAAKSSWCYQQTTAQALGGALRINLFNFN